MIRKRSQMLVNTNSSYSRLTDRRKGGQKDPKYWFTLKTLLKLIPKKGTKRLRDLLVGVPPLTCCPLAGVTHQGG